MDWAKAKNIIIVLLVLLNIVLSFFVYIDSRKYVLSNQEEIGIIDILRQNKISIYTEITKNFKPMKKLSVSKYNFDYNFILKIFFKDVSSVVRNENEDMKVFSDKTGTLTILKEYVYYESTSTAKIIENDSFFSENANKMCKDIIKKLGKDFANFELDTNYSNLEVGTNLQNTKSMFIYYKEKYANYIINSNYVQFVITEAGIKEVMIANYKPLGFIKQSEREICSPSEALFTFMRHMKSINEDKEIFINKIDIVYDLEKDSTEKNSVYAVPYYRFYIKGSEEPILVNAYFNKILEK